MWRSIILSWRQGTWTRFISGFMVLLACNNQLMENCSCWGHLSWAQPFRSIILVWRTLFINLLLATCGSSLDFLKSNNQFIMCFGPYMYPTLENGLFQYSPLVVHWLFFEYNTWHRNMHCMPGWCMCRIYVLQLSNIGVLKTNIVILPLFWNSLYHWSIQHDCKFIYLATIYKDVSHA